MKRYVKEHVQTGQGINTAAGFLGVLEKWSFEYIEIPIIEIFH